jgi:hypothetical protein
MAAADNINTPAQTLIKQALIIIMSAELISVADQETDTVQGCFNQALMVESAVHIAGHAQHRNPLGDTHIPKVGYSITAVNQTVKGSFAVDDFLQAFALAMAVGNNQNLNAHNCFTRGLN